MPLALLDATQHKDCYWVNVTSTKPEVAELASALLAEFRQLAKHSTDSRLAYTLDETADALGLSKRVVEGLITRGELRSRMAGQTRIVSRAEILRFLGVSN